MKIVGQINFHSQPDRAGPGAYKYLMTSHYYSVRFLLVRGFAYKMVQSDYFVFRVRSGLAQIDRSIAID